MPLRAFGGGLGEGPTFPGDPYGAVEASGAGDASGPIDGFGSADAGVPIGGGVGGGVAAAAGLRGASAPANVRASAAPVMNAIKENGFTHLGFWSGRNGSFANRAGPHSPNLHALL